MNWEALVVAVGLIDIVVTVVMAVWVRSLDGRTATIEAQGSRIDNLEKQVRTKTEEFVDVRFAQHTAEFNGTVTTLSTLVDQILKRLDRGDNEFREGDQARHELEINVITKMAEKCVSKAEFERFEQRFEHRMLGLENSLTRLAASSRNRSDQ